MGPPIIRQLLGPVHMDQGEWPTAPVHLGAAEFLKAKSTVEGPCPFILLVDMNSKSTFYVLGMLNKQATDPFAVLFRSRK